MGESRQKPKSLESQEGGTHYKDMAIEPAEFCQRNRFNFCESDAIKYLSRHRFKGGSGDVKKALHCCRMILDMDYGVGSEVRYEDAVVPDNQSEDTAVEDDVRTFSVTGDHLASVPRHEDSHTITASGDKVEYTGWLSYGNIKPGSLKIVVRLERPDIRVHLDGDLDGRLWMDKLREWPILVGFVNYLSGWVYFHLGTGTIPSDLRAITPLTGDKGLMLHEGHPFACDYQVMKQPGDQDESD